MKPRTSRAAEAAVSAAERDTGQPVTSGYKSSSEILQTPFCLDSLDDIPTPSGCEGTWYRYVIRQGDNVIVGMRGGERSEVVAVVDDYVNRLNIRFAKHQAKAAR
jgi:hypothetical protein